MQLAVGQRDMAQQARLDAPIPVPVNRQIPIDIAQKCQSSRCLLVIDQQAGFQDLCTITGNRARMFCNQSIGLGLGDRLVALVTDNGVIDLGQTTINIIAALHGQLAQTGIPQAGSLVVALLAHHHGQVLEASHIIGRCARHGRKAVLFQRRQIGRHRPLSYSQGIIQRRRILAPNGRRSA